MRSRESRISSDLPVPPGEILAKEIEDQGMTQKEARGEARATGPGDKRDHQGKEGDHGGYGHRVGEGTGDRGALLGRLEADYRMTLARNRERDRLAADVEWLKEYPISEMIERGWIQGRSG